MSGCCSPRFYGKVFSEKTARRDARRYRKKGLKASERDVIDFLRGRAETVLEIGGGVGAIEIELLKGGAVRAMNAELSPSYEDEAKALAAEAGVGDRFAYRVANIVDEDLEHADAVVMHRVVCCYPDGEGLVRRAADHARTHLLITFPREAPWVRTGFAAFNFAMWALRFEFRAYVHPVDRLLAAADGLHVVHERRGLAWQLAVLERDYVDVAVAA